MAIVEDIERIEYRKNGVPLTEVKLDEDRLAVEVAKFAAFTVVNQSLRSGSTVPRGTLVDVTVATTSKLPVAVIANVPKVWEALEIGVVARKVRERPNILKLLGEKESFEELKDEERAEVVSFLESSGMPLPSAELASGYGALRNSHLLAD